MESIVFQHHNPAWFLKFNDECKLLQKRLTKYLVNIHHIGSTAVPGIMAKPIIDIAVESSVYPPTASIQLIFAEMGYECRGESGIVGRIWFTKGHPRDINLHYCPIDSKIVKKQICFRECLKRNAVIRTAYETLKINNGKGLDIDDGTYAQSKSQLIEAALANC